jgi:hypothetical protein
MDVRDVEDERDVVSERLLDLARERELERASASSITTVSRSVADVRVRNPIRSILRTRRPLT